MVKPARVVEIREVTDLATLAEDVRRTQQPCVLRMNGEDIAILTPAKPARNRTPRSFTEEDDAAFLASAGGWKGLVDVEKFLEENYAQRRRSIRPAVELR